MTTAPPHPAAAAAAAHPAPPWHLAGALVSLKAGVDAHWPNRDKRSDGGIGDARHAAEGAGSDHNAWLSSSKGPAVRAYDFTAAQPGIPGVDGGWLAESLRLAGAAGDERLAGRSGNLDDNGYVIWQRHISAPDFSRWVPYDGTDDHTTHVHVSVTRDPAGFEDGAPWAFLVRAPEHPTPAPAPAPANPEPAPVGPAPDGQQPPVIGPHPGNTAHQAPAPVADLDGPEPGNEYAPPGHDAVGQGPTFRAQHGNEGPRVADLQRALNSKLELYSQIAEDGVYGDETAGVVQDFARRAAADPNCPAELRAPLAHSHGDNVGHALAAMFPRYGIHI